VGEIVLGANQGCTKAIVEVADMDHMELIAKVGEDAVGKVKAGQSVRVHLKAYPNETFAGTVAGIALDGTQETDGTHSFRGEISLNTAGRQIAAGLSGEAVLEHVISQ
jgi:hypothetical protein